MQRWFNAVAGWICTTSFFWGTQGVICGEDASASSQRLRSTVEFLASDELEGRGVDTAGINKAADYLATEFQRLGLRTDLFDGTPFQKFEITVKSELGPAEKNQLAFAATENGQGQKRQLELGREFTPLAVGGSGQIDAPLVFAGYGITSPEFKYDDYAGLDVKGKVVLILRKEPQQADEKSVFSGQQPSPHASFMRKIANASEHGAAAVILVNDEYDALKKSTEDRQAWRKELDQLAAAQAKLASGTLAAEDTAKLTGEINGLAESIATRGRRLREGYDELLAFSGAGEESGHRKMPVWFCLRAAVEPLLQQAYGRSLAAVEQEIDATLKPVSKDLPWRVLGSAEVAQVKAEVKNVLAVLEGEGPLAEETIVVGAHYDHVGWGGPGSLAPWTRAVHNGADDNASGTAALLETARQLATAPNRPRRRIVFAAFTGEERGLLGSAYYCRHPRFALENTVAMFNYDMVGRLQENKLIVYGTGTAKEFDGLINDLAATAEFQLTRHEGGFGPSDHASFYAQKIPVLHFFTGTHDDYHRPGDDAEKINVAGIERIVQLATKLVRQVDASPQRPQYVEIKKVEHIGSGGDRPYFGSIPDYSQSAGEGLAITGAVKDGPADKAGLRAGDVIIGLGESKITGIEDFDSALRKFKPGDRVKVIVRREGKEVELEVQLGKRK